MLKPIFIILFSIFIINNAKGQKPDTTVVYFKTNANGYYKVNTLDSADFFRIILPPDSGDTKYNIREYYKDGKIKMVGKSDARREKFKSGQVSLSGNCISYYLNGKKESIAHYSKNHKDGLEYIYYPSGKVYFTLKHIISGKYGDDEVLYWECYDTIGKMLCDAGNGTWVTYDREYKNVLITGTVKKGYREGEWKGRVLNADSIKYVYKYSRGVVDSCTGYDKKGTAYPFILINVAANYRGGFRTFIDELNQHLNVPRGPYGKKIVLDNIKIAFTVEKDSTTSHLETLGIDNEYLNKPLAEALSKCRDWTPTRFYGVPYQTRVTLPLKYLSKAFGNGEIITLHFDEKVIGD